ncbi:hypothetical protein EVU96_25040 [Bacillus infantis]|nr:hypothetical protein EVU96_25040 [Bacillus infantis]
MIELNGTTAGVLAKNLHHVVFYFNDSVHGKILVTADRDCPLYYERIKRKRLKLKVYLRGHTVLKHGELFTNNYLFVKEILEQEKI